MIDFVIFWVDGDDPAWRRGWAEARRAAGPADDGSELRVRSWDNLHYWFRGVERFVPWVRRVHLVTCGHLPKWLAAEHPKLHVVRHDEFIPPEYLPTWNSLTIGLNLHRIKGLAEQFVVFNDDMFLLRPCRERDFFRHGKPCDMARLSVVTPSGIAPIILNDLELLSTKYRPHEVVRRHFGRWFSPRYGIANLLKTTSLLPWSRFTGLSDPHLPQPSLRSHWAACWAEWGGAFDRTCRQRLRNRLESVSDYMIRYDALCQGLFVPRSPRDGALLTLRDDTLEEVCRSIEARRWRQVCLNDGEPIADFAAAAERLRAAFQHILPDKSSYEI